MEQALPINPVRLRSRQEVAAASVPSDQCPACLAAPMIGFHRMHFHSRFLCIGCDAQAAGVDEIFAKEIS